MDAIVIKLSEPIEANGEIITEITLQQPRAKHMRGLPVGAISMGALLNLASEVSGVPPSSMDKLTGGDAMKVVEAVGNFLAGGPGETPSP